MNYNEAFWERVDTSGDCWEWKGDKTGPNGYGRFRGNRAHRIMWNIMYGGPGDMCVLHKCDNRGCVRPKHLFLGTHQDNSDDMVKKGRSPDQRGEKNSNAKLDFGVVLLIRVMLDHGYKQSELAERFGVCQQTISKIKHNKRWRNQVVTSPSS